MFFPARKPASRKLLKNPMRKDVISAQINKSLRYPSLVGKNWKILPKTIQQRFIRWTPPRELHIYHGRTLETRLNFYGHIFANFSRLIGAPLPLSSKVQGPVIVIVREANKFNGQFWTRIYCRNNKTPQIIHSIKKFAGPTGLEEMLNMCIGISLKLTAQNDSLIFTSENYFIKIFNYRINIPNVITPGILRVTHRENGNKRFRFTLELNHPVLGELIYQTALFRDNNQ